jgi:hypothetical protein
MKLFTFLLLLVYSMQSFAQFQPNYDESKVPDYTLPEILISNSEKKISNTQDWENIRRPEILDLFKDEVYGNIPQTNVEINFEEIESSDNVLDGIATRKQIQIVFSKGDKRSSVDLLIYLPSNTNRAVPVFLGYNFYGNHSIHPDANILLPQSWMRNNSSVDILDNRSNELSRGFRTNRWPIHYILSRGYGLAVMYYGDIDPDFDDGFKNGLHPLFYFEGQMKPKANEWGSIGAWAFGLSKAMDYFEQDDDIDQKNVAVIGHSRLGKTSLWAGAMDERFALVISNESGCGGAALSMRRFGETVGRINRVFPHWFCDNFNRYNENEDALPVDQHMLIALMAPRPVYIASAERDPWADPKGEFLSGVMASPIYEIYGLKGVQKESMPSLNSPYQDGYIGYHIRSGDHDLTYYDWLQFLNFADKHLK